MAYAAVISLMSTITRLDLPIKELITETAHKELKALVSMLKRLDHRSAKGIDRSVIHELDAKMRDAVWEIEDVLDVINPPYSIKQELDLFLKTVKILGEEYCRELDKTPLPQASPMIDVDFGENKSSMTVGLSDISEKIRRSLLDGSFGIAFLWGMAGIGKTHLAREIYQHPHIIQHFDTRVWVRVGPKDQIDNVLLAILAQIEGKNADQVKEEGRALIHMLENILITRRYLIVLDDVWSSHVLEKLDFPDSGNGSRVLVTTRLKEVSYYDPLQMPFLNKEESWNLLWVNVFGEECFPYKLEKAGRKIAEKCEGLPLLILAVATLLSELDMTEEYWEKVANNETTTFTDAYDQIYEVLLPSYEYLPQYLKPCFLYMGVFPQTCEILISKIINLWTTEDFVEQMSEARAVMKYMKGLISHSLALVGKQSSMRGDIKSCRLHCAYWYLCVKEARKSKFLHVLHKLSDVSSVESSSPHRLSVQNNVLFCLKGVYEYDTMPTNPSTTRSLLFTGEDHHQYPVHMCVSTMLLLKVLDALAIRFYEFPNEVLKLRKLRYLALTHHGELPGSINKLQHLQCLILRRHHNVIKLAQRDSRCLPVEIWDMQELKHLQIKENNLPDPCKRASKLHKLLTLSVNANSCTAAVFKSIPIGLKKLGIQIELEPDATEAETFRWLEYLGLLRNLNSLKCVVVNPRLRSQPVDHICFPLNLTKLSLNGLGYSWMRMYLIGSMVSLKVLKLRCSAYQGPEWEIEYTVSPFYQFLNLEYLLLEDLDLVHWIAERSPNYEMFPNFNNDIWFFPRLRHLIVRHCYKLKKIPYEIGCISPLEIIEVDECGPSVVESARKIEEKKRREKSFTFEKVIVNTSWNIG